ncbi:MAG: kelch repeat-containing protein [Bacteroidota bacterium]
MPKPILIRLLLIVNLFFTLNVSSQNYTWMRGSSTATMAGTYGTQGVSSALNDPGARRGCATWTDASGNLWLFGGEGVVANNEWFNDLWKYNPTTNQWTWIKGPNAPNTPGIMGVQGTPAAANNPGPRVFSMSWTDPSGNFWLFGGAINGAQNKYADLWKYNPTTNMWTWVSGPNALDVNGVYGTQNVPSPAVFPGGRHGGGTWVDGNGKLWLFGGRGFGASTTGRLNDLWKFDPTNNQWTWITGSQTQGVSGVFGTLSVPSSANTPGARDFPAAMVSLTGKLILFGGQGYASTATIGLLSDMWEFNTSTGQWTWVNGPNIVNQWANYGTQGVSATGNMPGARSSAASWVDAMGDYWIFGGQGFATTAAVAGLNDLFKFNPVTGQWTWMKGSNQVFQVATYGTQGVPAPANTPGGRDGNTWWKNTSSNHLWLFGGFGLTSIPSLIQSMNDLWRFKVPCHADSLVTLQVPVICSGNSINIAAHHQFPSTVNWHTTPTPGTSVGSGTLFSTPTLSAQAGNTVYTYYAQANSCTMSPLAMISITVLPLPQLSITGPASVCPLQQTTLNVSGAQSYTWNNTSTTTAISFAPAAPMGFTVNGTGANNCGNTISYSLGIYNLPNIIATTSKGTICRFEEAILTAGGGASYLWNGTTNSPTLSVSPTISTTYTVSGTDVNGCSNSFTITQFVSVCIGVAENINAPLPVYPNPGNGFVKIYLQTPGSFIVFNQLGMKILEKKLLPGENAFETGLDNGVYFYKLYFKNEQSQGGKLIVE